MCILRHKKEEKRKNKTPNNPDVFGCPRGDFRTHSLQMLSSTQICTFVFACDCCPQCSLNSTSLARAKSTGIYLPTLIGGSHTACVMSGRFALRAEKVIIIAPASRTRGAGGAAATAATSQHRRLASFVTCASHCSRRV